MLKLFPVLLMALASSLGHAAESIYDPVQNTWILNNGWIQATFQLTPDSRFITQSINDLRSGDFWLASLTQPSSPIHLQAGNDLFDARRQYQLLSQYTV